jgi:hypothetical protein
MKHLKTYEKLVGELRRRTPNFKEGDFVICIDPYNDPDNTYNNLERDKQYQITYLEQNFDGVWRCSVDDREQKYYCFRFLSELEYNANKYNI